ncbi:hypothetical protein [Pedobacter miscanthi]|uniref:Outer membrane protein beta-barrel domain-containing protein n=1 Tax=Pedobacter miscanthi TaxID=2259170 RepID=A0A366L0Q2_9SPHI|nr:hypothetical protein [Pedobacter miscanthi]RBQ06732.1 hypothetical protein DRW42_13205 [Pedobacter miscanthi]
MKNQFKTIAASLLFISLMSILSPVQAQRAPGIRYSAGVEGGLPISNLSDNYTWSLGGSIQADIPLLKQDLYLTFNAGFYNLFTDSKTSGVVEDIQLIPVKAGLKYFPVVNFYIQGEAGVSFLLNDSPIADKSASFTWAPQVGYLIPVGAKSYIDAGFRYEGNSKFYEAGKSNGFLGLRVAYAFPIEK